MFEHRQYRVFACLGNVRNSFGAKSLGVDVKKKHLNPETQMRLNHYQYIQQITVDKLSPKTNEKYWSMRLEQHYYIPLNEVKYYLNVVTPPSIYLYKENKVVIRMEFLDKYLKEIDEESYAQFCVKITKQDGPTHRELIGRDFMSFIERLESWIGSRDRSNFRIVFGFSC
jgi:hypothetical protein